MSKERRLSSPARILLAAILLAAAPSCAKLKFKILPALGYSTDEGLGLGARVDLEQAVPDSIEGWYVSGQTSFSTKGMQGHYLLVDFPRSLSIAGRPLRTTAKLAYDRSLYENYFGAGNDVRPDAELTDDHFYAYERRYPSARVCAGYPVMEKGRWTLGAKAGLFAEYDWILRSQKRPPGGVTPLLFAERPRGIDGGALWGASAGLTIDSRDNERNPARGLFAGILTHLVPGALGNDYGFAQACVFEVAYLSILRDVILVQRALVDGLTQGAPFYRDDDMLADGGSEGIVTTSALGGRGALKGVETARYAGNLKALVNLEARWFFWRFTLFKDPSKLGVAAGIDAGRVWVHAADVSLRGVHVTYSGGLRLVWGRLVVGADAGFYEGPVPRVYVTTGHPF